MNAISLPAAFARLGATFPGGVRVLCATATDGTLVLVCQSGDFVRPGAGVLRCTARLSTSKASRAQVAALRSGLEAAALAGSAIRCIIQTPAAEHRAARVHARADLVGSVSSFDGDAYSVDFVRPVASTVAIEPRARRTPRR